LKKPVKILAVVLIIVVIAAIIIVPKLFSTKEQSGPNQRQNQQSQVISADGFIIKEQNLDNEIRTIGSIRANEEVEIRSEVSRKITKTILER